jgi:hypothetical protein
MAETLTGMTRQLASVEGLLGSVTDRLGGQQNGGNGGGIGGA